MSREVASRASATTGVGADVLKKLLPIVATMVMGSMSRQAGQAGLGRSSTPQAPSRDLLGGLGSLLDSNQDGSIADDLLGMAKKLF